MERVAPLERPTAVPMAAWTAAPLMAASLASLAAGAILAGAGYATQQLTAVAPRLTPDYDFSPWEMGVSFEEVSFSAVDGAQLRGWFLTRPESRRVIVGLGGYRSRRPELLGIGTALWRAGYNVLLFDYRGHGESEGRRVTLGHQETSDFRSALTWLRGRLPGAWIGTIGYSMGGAVALLGTAAEPDIRAVVTDCAFSSQQSVIRLAWRRRTRLPDRPFIDVANLLVGRFHGFRFEEVEPIAVIEKIAPRPLLLIHSIPDRTVPVEHGQRLFAAAGEPKQLWLIPDQPHCGAYFADRIGYTRRVIEFFDAAAAG